MGRDDNALQGVLRDLLIALSIAVTIEFIRQGDATILGTLKVGRFEVTFLWSLCVILVVTRFAMPLLVDSWRKRYLDWDDFKNLEEDARGVREDFQQRRHTADSDEKDSQYATQRHNDLRVHLDLLRIHMPSAHDDPTINLFDEMARLIKLMQRGDLKNARKRYPRTETGAAN